MFVKILVAVSVICMLPLSVVAQQACTEMGCEDGLKISIAPDYKWERGNYKFSFSVDGKNLNCEGNLPFASCEQNIKCDGTGVMITESGCAMPQETHGFGDINLPSSPKSVALEIARNGVVIGKNNFQPTYTTVTPNGVMCEPKCHQATVQFELK